MGDIVLKHLVRPDFLFPGLSTRDTFCPVWSGHGEAMQPSRAHTNSMENTPYMGNEMKEKSDQLSRPADENCTYII